MGGVHGDVDAVLAVGKQNLVYFRRADGPHVINRVGLIGAVEVFRGFVGAAIKRLIFPKREVHAAKPEALFLGEIDINRGSILPLVLRMLGGEKPVPVSVDRSGEIRHGISVQNTEAVSAGS